MSFRAPSLFGLLLFLGSCGLGACGGGGAPPATVADDEGCGVCRAPTAQVVGQDALAPDTEAPPPDDDDAPPAATCDGEPCSQSCGHVRYPQGVTHSPLPCSVAENLRQVRAQHPQRAEDALMKVGDSISATHEFLFCFETEEFSLEDTGHGELADARAHFREGRVEDTTPFDRYSHAAVVGQTAAWALGGSPSPFEQEVSATNAAYSLVLFGTNDINFGGFSAAPEVKFPWMAQHMRSLLDAHLQEGVVPVLYSLPPYRGAEPLIRYLTPSYNAILRALAESRQIPFVDYHTEMLALPDAGLRDDGVHPSADYVRLCGFDEEGLQYGYNLRNLLTLEALDRVWRVTREDDGVVGFDEEGAPPIAGEGSGGSPYVIPQSELPFADLRLPTRGGEQATLEGECGQLPGETRRSTYRFNLDEETPMRVMAIGFGGALVRVSVDDEAAPSCPGEVGLVSAPVAAGSHVVTLEAALPEGGEALLLLAPCDEDDPRCR